MSAGKKYTYRTIDWVVTIEFLPDSIEYSWDEWGWGVDKGKRTFSRDELSPHLNEFTGETAGWKKLINMAGSFFILTMFSYVLLPYPWRFSSILFCAYGIWAAIRGIKQMRKNDWFLIMKKNGYQAVPLKITKWTKNERADFKSFYEDWINESKYRQPWQVE